MANNHLAYARAPYQDLYGAAQERFRTAAAPLLKQPMHRIYSAVDSPSFGPLNGTLDTRMEVTFGYNPLELSRYQRYLAAAEKNPLLLNGLAVTAALNPNGMFATNPAALPRIYAPDSVSSARTQADSMARLATLNPAREAVAEGIAPIPLNGGVRSTWFATGLAISAVACLVVIWWLAVVLSSHRRNHEPGTTTRHRKDQPDI
jgi:hypothetical protein